MTAELTKADLRCIWTNLNRHLPPGGRPPTPEDLVEIGDVLTKVAALIESDAGLTQRGRKIFEWRLHAKDAPTQNEIRGLAWGSPFAIKSKEKRIDTLLAAVIEATPGALVHGNKTKRWVRVTRFSPSSVDDPTAVDAIGGKMPLDALVRAKVLNDDTESMCHREGGSRKTRKGNVHVLVEVFEMAEVEAFDPGPIDAEMPPRTRAKPGTFVDEVLEEAAEVPEEVQPSRLLKGRGPRLRSAR
jgi:hypothetical protein